MTATITWIPAATPPETAETVLVACDVAAHGIPVWLGCYWVESRLWLDAFGANIAVTHWARLPDPPRGEPVVPKIICPPFDSDSPAADE